MPVWNNRGTLVAGLLPLFLLAPISVRKQQPSLSCQFVSFKVVLNASDDFQRELGGGLLFRVTHQKQQAWFVDIVPAEENTKDYIYPVNPPLRFNPNQTLGPGYSETIRSSLSHPHEMKFLLDRLDYDRISGLVGNVLWPSQTPDPDKALSDYDNAVDDARKGSLKVTVSSYKTDPKTGTLAHIKLRVMITTPPDFQFAPGLNAWPAACAP
ncbi:MAG: hypothetical protein WB919_09305 [Candidatus Sulfotelmatobacter sp.]